MTVATIDQQCAAHTIVGRQRPGNTMTDHAESNDWRLSSAQSITITACLQRTVTGNGTHPFYFGWSAAFDMTTAISGTGSQLVELCVTR